MDTRATDQLLSTTRAVRRRLDLTRPVERDVVLDCLRLAVQAPTGGNGQRWRWLVVQDPEKRAQLARLYADIGAQHLKTAAAEAEDRQTQRVYESALYLSEILDRVPMHVIPCVEGRADNSPNWRAATFYGSILPAVWSFQLALRSRGLGSALTTIHLYREHEAAALLGIPDTVTQVALLPVAYTTGGDFKPAARPPIEGITYWDEWGSGS